ncbi:hypothetical protein [Bacillus sp. Marseille-P3661]|uniref:hypothetical protein n=1 Tax=Bacillus sp. Marseille-P3661 TaxID=1936234 RepID=UPI000C833A64|nr:hypothetical protein [Bacillus sp. Marseille-P3661]
MNKPWWLSHIIRWLLIIILLVFISAGFTSHPFNLEKSIKGSLTNMELPNDVDVLSVVEDQGLYSVLFIDNENNLYHQSDYKKKLGLFWTPIGGSFGYEKDPTILAKYHTGMSTHGKKRFYYVIGYVQDPEVENVKIDWGNGIVEKFTPVDGFYQFVKTTDISQEIFGSGKVMFYDSNEKLLYTLDYEKNQIKSE